MGFFTGRPRPERIGLSPQTVREFVEDRLITHILAFDRNPAKYIHEREAEDADQRTDESRSGKNDGLPPE